MSINKEKFAKKIINNEVQSTDSNELKQDFNVEPTQEINKDYVEENLQIEITSNECSLLDLEPATSISISKVVGESGVLSIINSDKNGKRLTIAKEVMDKLKNPEKVQVGFTQDSIVIGESLPNNNNFFNIKTSGTKKVLYASKLVLEITDRFCLDFNNKVSITLHEVKYVPNGDYIAAMIKVKSVG